MVKGADTIKNNSRWTIKRQNGMESVLPSSHVQIFIQKYTPTTKNDNHKGAANAFMSPGSGRKGTSLDSVLEIHAKHSPPENPESANADNPILMMDARKWPGWKKRWRTKNVKMIVLKIWAPEPKHRARILGAVSGVRKTSQYMALTWSVVLGSAWRWRLMIRVTHSPNTVPRKTTTMMENTKNECIKVGL